MQKLSISDWANKFKYLDTKKTKVLSQAKSPVESIKFSLMNANLIFKHENAFAMLSYSICKKFNVSPQTKISIFKNKKEAEVFSEKHIKPKNAN